jgi:DNA-binding NarL/FixJ family response regulator
MKSTIVPLKRLSDGGRGDAPAHPEACPVIVVERSALLRDCLSQNVAAGFAGHVSGYARLSDIPESDSAAEPPFVLVSLLSLDRIETQKELAALVAASARARILVLARADDPVEARIAVTNGAKGYISAAANFEMFVLALKCVAAGGGYISTSCFDEAQRLPAEGAGAAGVDGVTAREMQVIQAIRQGKPNKIIAYDLGVCEGTVKAHIRHIMKKLGSKNRTEIAIRGLGLSPYPGE